MRDRWLRAFLGLAVLGCSANSTSPDTRIAVMVPDDAGPLACAVDTSTEMSTASCWAVGRMITRTGCSDTHCEWDGGILARKADYAACGIAAPDPANDAQASSELTDVPGVLSLNDDLCEYHAFVLPECSGGARTLSFDAELSPITGGVVPAGAKPYIEAFSSPVHVAPNTDSSVEPTPGHYRIGPVTFDVPGQWTVTLHFFGTCRDSEPMSPHAHVTFELIVP